MSIRIDKNKCIGCRNCISVCPGNLIIQRYTKAHMQYPKDCWGCASCVKACPAGAIEFFLGADIGGNGSTMKVKREKSILHWIIEKQDGQVITLDVNRKDSNKY